MIDYSSEGEFDGAMEIRMKLSQQQYQLSDVSMLCSRIRYSRPVLM